MIWGSATQCCFEEFRRVWKYAWYILLTSWAMSFLHLVQEAFWSSASQFCRTLWALSQSKCTTEKLSHAMCQITSQSSPFHCNSWLKAMHFLIRTFGMRRLWRNLLPSTGEWSLFWSHSSIASRSYECPSAANTGSCISPCMAHVRSLPYWKTSIAMQLQCHGCTAVGAATTSSTYREWKVAVYLIVEHFVMKCYSRYHWPMLSPL